MDFNIPVKKSFILSELQFETEASFYQPYSYKKPEKKIIKKASPLLVLCLAKFYNKYLKNVFLRIKSYKRVKFNVQLLNEKNIRNMKESFFKIYSYTL